MPIVGITLDTTREFVSSYDDAKGTPEATVFIIGTLDSRIFGLLRDKGTTLQVDTSRPNDEVQTQINASEVAFLTVQYGLKGWKNFRDAAGNDLVYKTVRRTHSGQTYSVVDPEILKRLPSAIITELAEQIRSDNEMSESEVKN